MATKATPKDEVVLVGVRFGPFGILSSIWQGSRFVYLYRATRHSFGLDFSSSLYQGVLHGESVTPWFKVLEELRHGSHTAMFPDTQRAGLVWLKTQETWDLHVLAIHALLFHTPWTVWGHFWFVSVFQHLSQAVDQSLLYETPPLSLERCFPLLLLTVAGVTSRQCCCVV